ncbi:glycosyltransferase [Bacillus sp. Y1]|nr:glycosyltransferase [Bacillus sp. Y1]AYA78620.1 glycosyltransferase [Bacillus sp. Y1]
MLTSMNIGGVEKSLLALLSVIPRENYDITILLLEKKGGFLSSIPKEIKVEEVGWFSKIKPLIMNSPYDVINDLLRNKRIIDGIRYIYSYLVSKHFNNRYLFYKTIMRDIPKISGEYDIAIAYQGPTDIIDFFIAEKINARKKIAWVHFDVRNHKINSKLYNKIYTRFEKIRVVSKQGLLNLIEVVPSVEKKVEVFSNIVPISEIKELAQKPIKFDEEYDGVKIVTVGRLSMEKGQDIAIKVLFRLKNEGYNIRWYCIGEGNDRKFYESLIEKYCLHNDFLLLGAMQNPYPYILKSDIYVQTSRHEGYCLTLAEAKCLRKPIITTNFVGAYEQITDEFNGLIVNCSENGIYSKVKSLIDDISLRKNLVGNIENQELNEIRKIENVLR